MLVMVWSSPSMSRDQVTISPTSITMKLDWGHDLANNFGTTVDDKSAVVGAVTAEVGAGVVVVVVVVVVGSCTTIRPNKFGLLASR